MVDRDISKKLLQLDGIQFTGRHAWPDEQTNAARVYARESTPQNLAMLRSAQKASAETLGTLQEKLHFSYATDGGFGLKDDFIPYIEKVKGITGAEGQINQQPGTRNQYYFIPSVSNPIDVSPDVLEPYLMPSTIPSELKRKLILVSPLSFALAAENTAYPDRVALLHEFAKVQREAIRLVIGDYQYVQLNESFAVDERFSDKVTKDLLSAFRDSLNAIFGGLPVRSAIYFSSGDATRFIPAALDSKVTDIGFDFNTPASGIGVTIDRNLILGMQNVTRKLPADLLRMEPVRLAHKVRVALSELSIDGRALVYVGQSQGSDGLQTYPQAIERDKNLASAYKLLSSGIA